ncbi:uncharacterized protein LOC121834549 [Ixodes scapularis]|uniref:uncharacterized protein LOC121834549 n=1 Tax=Ixodes scapularis TaxID=6945 RepID=UPI001C37F5DB|nr:uncharacterized protein LOC121834549 [Ixodes scapularis]
MEKLPQTFMLQSALDLQQAECYYHHFYNHTERNQTYRKYGYKFIYNRHTFRKTFYVKNVTGYNISMAEKPEAPVTFSRQILFSNMRSCMIIRNPDPRKSKECYLMVTKERFSKPLTRCRNKFEEHCKGPAFNYTIGGCDKPENHN